jgi:hypothetical protein
LKNTALQESIQNQRSASKLLLASQIQTMNESMLKQIHAQKAEVFAILLSKIRGIYDVDAGEFDDHGYDVLTSRIRTDLHRLQAFQTERVNSTQPQPVASRAV